MSWLDERVTNVRFECEDKHLSVVSIKASEINYDEVKKCLECDKDAVYAGFEPEAVNLVSKVLFQQNGRYGYRFSDGKGKVSHMSKTRYDYLQTGKIENKYTPDYKRELQKSGDSNLLESNTHSRRADVQIAKGKIHEG